MKFEAENSPAPATAKPIGGIRLRVLLPLAVAIVVLMAAFVARFLQDKNDRAGESVTRAANSVEELLKAQLNDNAALMSSTIEALLRDDQLEAALAAKDRDALLKIGTPILNGLREHNRITHLYLHSPDGVNLVRVHHPEEFGDKIGRFTLSEARRTGKPTWGNEQGPFGTLTLRVVYPWYSEGKLLGYIELGKEVEDVLHEVRQMLGVDLVVVADKQFLDRAKWEKVSKSLNKPAQWDRFKSAVLISQTMDTIPAPIEEYLAGRSDAHEKVGFEVSWGTNTNQAMVVPFSDVKGRVLGDLIVLRDITDAARAANRSAIGTLAVCVTIGAALCALFYVYLGRVQRDLAERSTRLAEASQKLAVETTERRRAQRENELQREKIELLEIQGRLSQELAAARDTADAANRAKSAFLANMSHEIRTPMTAIIGYADMMLEPDQTLSDRLDCLHVIRRNARHLGELINDVLDLSKIEANRMTVESIDFDLPQLMVDLASMLRPRAEEKGVTFKLDFIGPIPKRIHTDPLRLKQVLVNLVGNAIKFTSTGTICVAVSCERNVSASSSRLRFAVTDTGIGMTDDQLAILFRPFTQADVSTTRRFGGTGLGLTISKRLCEMLGGDLTASSVAGQGSTFTVNIEGGELRDAVMIENLSESMITPSETAGTTSEKITLSGRILLAEDGIDNQRLIALHLRKAGAEVTIASNGRIAVELARSQSFDVILMDMQMPELDGYGATSELRRRGFTLPILALTAHAMSDDREKCLRSGCTDYLTKPIEKQLLLRTVKSYLLQATRMKNSPATSTTGTATVHSSIAGDADMKAILEQFVAGLRPRVERIEDLLKERDLESLKREMHQLKGAGGGYGFAEITTLAAAAEARIKENAELDQIVTDVQSLIDLVRRVDGFGKQSEDGSATKASHH